MSITPCLPSSLSHLPGIYRITNLANGYAYIGSAVNLSRRWRFHLYQLNKGVHHNPRMQSAWIKYGSQNFIFTVLEIVEDRNDLIRVEQEWLDITRAAERREYYNFSPTAGSQLGIKRRPETIARLSESQKGKKASDEAKEKMRAAKLGRKQSLEHLRSASKARLGRPVFRPTGIYNYKTRKFTDDQVREIRSKKHEGVSYSVLSSEYMACVGVIRRVVLRETYREII